ncbi:Holliday junction branch migration protein RuvA [Thioalkalivibrio paradoxus]|uniref:Holliday junction branch migration complex subunit RuvA n=1 Tax=Thioalkalivibrio paradoxus ARh 1 TaxID=713585 RepID=W0DGB0_9GAMM|nr:Holliday junction branch migration protein RuvA [Thioalkalivibrio paradoxus]AHE97401.1 Holliday junction DNA helicase RuvA [Thioalkalivibrio paradoxus ARh 1]
MIARLEGVLLLRDLQGVVLDVGGVGYEVEVPLSTLASLPEVGSRVVLFTHLMVREDAHSLFGFLKARDRDLFRRLIRVNGIGARLALAMLSTMAADELAGHITGGHTAALTRIPGIGKRTAERVVLELGERLADLGFGPDPGAASGAPAAGVEREAAAALEALGYRAADVERMLAAVRGQAESTEALVRLALRATLRS